MPWSKQLKFNLSIKRSSSFTSSSKLSSLQHLQHLQHPTVWVKEKDSVREEGLVHVRLKWWRERYEAHHRGVKRSQRAAAERGRRSGFTAPALDRKRLNGRCLSRLLGYDNVASLDVTVCVWLYSSQDLVRLLSIQDLPWRTSAVHVCLCVSVWVCVVLAAVFARRLMASCDLGRIQPG